MKHYFKILIALLLLPTFAFPAGKALPDKPNVIVLMTDDQGYGDLSCNGNPMLKTPNMDQLAREGVRFSNFHVDSYCAPTRSALMTGRYAHRVGVWGTVNGRNMLRDEEVTMADVFRHNGYRTGLFGKWHLGSNYPYRPIDRGFDEWLGHGDGGTGCTTDYWGNDRVNDHYIHNGQWESQPRPGYETDVFFDAAMQFIRENKGRSFFVFLPPYSPHHPCSIPDLQWAAPYRGKVPDEVAYVFGTIANVDENLGRLRRFLKDEGLADNTVLIFLTDNGGAQAVNVFNAGMRERKGSPYDGGHRVPCFLHWPASGLDKPVSVDRLAAHVDLLPTLVDLCALQLPEAIRFDGNSLKPLLANPHAPWPGRTLVMGSPENNTSANAPPPRFAKNCAVMTDRWRLVTDRELYDMTNDPGQKHDVAGQHPEIVKELHDCYNRYWADVSARDADWRGRPILGTASEPQVELCAEGWYATEGRCPWNQAAVARGDAAFGGWPVRFAEAGSYQIEVRRWPREADASITGVPADKSSADALYNDKPVTGLLYGGTPQALPVAKIQLKVGTSVQEAEVRDGDKVVTFTTKVDAGLADIETTLFDKAGKALCGAYYVCIRKTGQDR